MVKLSISINKRDKIRHCVPFDVFPKKKKKSTTTTTKYHLWTILKIKDGTSIKLRGLFHCHFIRNTGLYCQTGIKSQFYHFYVCAWGNYLPFCTLVFCYLKWSKNSKSNVQCLLGLSWKVDSIIQVKFLPKVLSKSKSHDQ